MPEDTQVTDSSIWKEAMLSLLCTADENMLHESGNPVYLALKGELK